MARSLFRNTLLYLPAQVLGPFVQFAVVVAWTHLLDPAAFGIVTFVVAAQELTALFGLFWWSIYVLRFRQRYEGADDDRFRAMDARMALCGSATQIAAAPLCLLAVGAAADVATVLAAAAYLVTRLLVAHYSEWARSQHRIRAYTAAQFAGPIFGSGLSILAVLIFGGKPAVVLASMALGQAAGAIAVMAALGVRLRPGAFDREIFLEARRYGAPLILGGLFGWAAINGIRVLVQAGTGVVGLGLLSAGWGLGQRVANFIAMVCTAAAFPIAVDRIESGDRKGALEQVSLNGTLMLALLAPATVGVAVLAAPVVNLLIATDYRSVTIFVLPIATAAGAVRTYKTHTADQAGLLLERTRALTVSNFADAVTTLVGAAIGLAWGGIEGAAVGCLAGTLLATLGALVYATRWLELPIHLGACLRILAGVGVMSAALILTPVPETALAIALKILLGAVCYGVALLALFPAARRTLTARLSS
ncbi:MAG TPA: lipopolysaccharide biosynthesis protein [Rhodoblastus sp.]|nr:lipopolysaccharide biosynthesis protein [Rhodoblastus sp.]